MKIINFSSNYSFNFHRAMFVVLMVLTSKLFYAQNPTVINDSLIVVQRVYAQEKLVVEQQAKFKEDIVVNGDARMKSDLRVDSVLRVDGNARFLSNVKMEGIGVTTLTDSSQILIILPNGQLKKGDIPGTISLGLPPAGIDLCVAENGVPKWWPGVKKLFTACPETNVGIATSNPEHKLHVVGVSYARNFLAGNSLASSTALINGYSFNNSQTLLELGVKIGSLPEESRFVITNNGNIKATNYGDNPSLVINNGTGHAIVVYANNGNKILQLEDNGLIRTREVRVDAANWADFVFDKNYNLPKLKDVAKFIEKNHRLPGIPSSKEIKENGINISEMHTLQMQKIEELTLYMIQMDEKMNLMQQEIEQLKSENNALKKSK